MFSIKLMGGLGNQMFIYAFAKSVEKMGYPIAFIAQDYINPRYFDSQDLKSALCSLQNRVNITDNLDNASLHSSTASNIPANNNALCGANPPSPLSDLSRQAEIFRFQINLPSDLSLGEFLPTFEPTTLPPQP